MGCVGSVAVEQKEEPAISPEEEELLREEATARFKIVDKDGSGSLDRDEVASLSQILGLKLSPPELDAAMVQMDADGSGEVDLDEFVAWWVARKKTPSTALRSEALAMFKSVDDDGSGSLGRSEVEKLASMLGFSFAAGELDAVMLHACGSSDGEVNSEQFFDWWASPSSPREALAMFNTVDEDRSGLLDAGELKTLTRMFGVELTDEELEMAMLQIDNDGSGEVDFDEFYVWWKAGGPEQAAAWALHDEAGNDTNAAQRELREKEKRRKQQRARIAAAKAAARKREEDMLGGLGDEELRQPELDGASAHDKKPKRKNRGVCCCWEKKISNREQARDLFDQVDDDGSGLLDMEEIAKLAELLGATLKQSELEDAMRVMDADGSGAVDFEEFFSWWQMSGGDRANKWSNSRLGKKTAKWARQQDINAGHLAVANRSDTLFANSMGGTMDIEQMRAEQSRHHQKVHKASIWESVDSKSGLKMWGRKQAATDATWEAATEHRALKWQSMHVWMNDADHGFMD